MNLAPRAVVWCVVLVSSAATAVGGRGVLVNEPNMKVLRCDMPGKGDRFVSSSGPGQLFGPGEAVDVKFVLTRGAQAGRNPAPAQVGVEIQEISTRRPGALIQSGEGFTDTAGAAPLLGLEGAPVTATIDVRWGEGPEQVVEAKALPVPEKFGTYALILKRPDAPGPQNVGGTRQFLATVARLPEPRAYGTAENTPVFGDSSFFDRPETYERRARQYAKMGVRGFRAEMSWSEDKAGQYHWERSDALFSALEKNGIQIMVTLGGHPDWSRPFGEPTPAVRWTPKTGGYGGTGDWCCDPKFYDRYGQWITAFCRRYWKDGRGGLWALEHYNEPWEGGGISGWARDCLEYRKLMKLIAASAWKVDRRIKTAAASSVMNTEDKFYSAGDREFDQYVDIFTDHYVPPNNCYGPLVAAAHGKTSQETETWFVNSEFMLPQAMCQFMACGQLRLSPWHPRVLFDKLPGKEVEKDEYCVPTPLVAATATFNYFTAGKKFKRLAFPDHLPWVFQFGEDDDHDALLVVFGQLFTVGDTNPRNRLWSQVDQGVTCGIWIDNADGLLKFFDPTGKPLFLGQSYAGLPSNLRATYVTCSKGPAAAIERLKQANLDAHPAIEFLPRDFTTPITSKTAKLVVGLHNCLNRVVAGKLRPTTPDGWELKEKELAVALKPGETRSFEFGIAKAATTAANAYPFEFTFIGANYRGERVDPDKYTGVEKYAETLSYVCVPKRTIAIDGGLDDWKDVPGITIVATTQRADASENARRPWTEMKDSQPDGSFAEVKLAYDERYLFVCARVNDTTPQADHGRLEGRDENQYFHTAADDSVSPYKEFLAKFPGRSFADVPYVYAKNPEVDIAFRGDRLQIGFDVDPAEKPAWHDLPADTDRVPYGFHAVPDTDYEYSLYLCSDGKSECWRLLAPGVPRMHDFPRQPRGAKSTGPAPGAKHVVKRDGTTCVYELALPRGELPGLAFASGTTFGFTFRVGNDKGPNIDYGQDKSVTKMNGLSLHPYWERKPSCGVRWALGD